MERISKESNFYDQKKKKIKPLIWLPKKVINGRLINLFEG